MFNNLNDNLNPACGKPAVQSYNMLDKRLSAVEKTVSGYSEKMSSQKGQFDNLEANSAVIAHADITSVDSEVVTSDAVKTGILQAGTTALGDTTVKSIKVIGEGGINLELDNANIKKAEIGDLHVSGELTMDNPILKRLDIQEDIKTPVLDAKEVKIKNKKALESLIQELSIGSEFKNIDFKSDMVPTWNNLEIATRSDVTGLNFKGIVSTEAELPSTANDGDLYWVSKPAAVAVFEANKATLTPMPALAAYRTAAEEDKINVEIQQNIDKANHDTNARVDETNKNVTTLDTRLTEAQKENDATHEVLTAAIDANKANIETEKARVDAIESDYVKNAPSDGNMYGMKNGTWQDLQKDSNFVPKEYKDETTDSHIFNDANGIDISSTKPVTVSTPEEKLETSKEIVNVDYMRKNLSISKSAGNATGNNLKHLFTTPYDSSSKGTNGPKSSWGDHYLGGVTYDFAGSYGLAHSGNFYDTTVVLKDYIVSYATNPQSPDDRSETWMNFEITDKLGNSEVLPTGTFSPQVWRKGFSSGPKLLRFDQKYIKNHPEYGNYFYIVCEGTPFIELWDGPKLLGKIEFPKDSSGDYTVVKDWVCANQECNNIFAAALKDKPEILFYKAGTNTGFILGLSEDRELDPLAMKRVSLPGYAGPARIAGGGTYWWGLNSFNGSRSSMMRVDSNGNTGSSPLQAEDGSGSVSASDCYDNTFGYLTLENGDVIFYITAKFAGADDYTTGFAYCYENPGDRLLPSYYINSTVCWGPAERKWAGFGSYWPFKEIGNYIFFFPTVECGSKFNKDSPDWSATTHGGNLDTQNQYAIINKTSHTITYATFPFAVGPRAWTQFKGITTKGGYTWVLPKYNVKDSKFLVISPAGAQQTIDIGTGSKYTWCGAVSGCNGNSTAYNAGWPVPCAAVNEDGIGCAISLERNAICIFYGNGEYKVWEFANPTYAMTKWKAHPLFNQGNPGHGEVPSVGDGGATAPSIIPIGKSFLCPDAYTAAGGEMQPTWIVPNENPLLEPTIQRGYPNVSEHGMGLSGCRSSYDKDQVWMDYRLQQTLLNNVQIIGHDTGAYIRAYVELPLKSADTIYLKDGDYVISDTSGTNYKKSVESPETAK